MKTFFFTLGILWGLLLTWFIIVYALQNLLGFSDRTATILQNIGGIILCIIGFILGVKMG